MKYLIFLGVGGGGVSRGGSGVSGSRVSGSGVGGGFVGGFVFGVFGLSGVFNLGDVAVVVISGVSDGLSAAIGQQNVVGSGDDFTVAALLVAEIIVRRLVLDLVGELVWHGGLLIPYTIQQALIKLPSLT